MIEGSDVQVFPEDDAADLRLCRLVLRGVPLTANKLARKHWRAISLLKQAWATKIDLAWPELETIQPFKAPHPKDRQKTFQWFVHHRGPEPDQANILTALDKLVVDALKANQRRVIGGHVVHFTKDESLIWDDSPKYLWQEVRFFPARSSFPYLELVVWWSEDWLKARDQHGDDIWAVEKRRFDHG